MKTFKKQAAQGDLLITMVEYIPSDLKKMKPENGNYIVAHSETGHHHTLPIHGVVVYEETPFSLYVEVLKETELKHRRSFDTHESLRVRPGKYRINRQREYTPEGFRRAAD